MGLSSSLRLMPRYFYADVEAVGDVCSSIDELDLYDYVEECIGLYVVISYRFFSFVTLVGRVCRPIGRRSSTARALGMSLEVF